ncbi:MAG: translation initiation factor IF-2 associated domain-containing protein, partial [Pseudomonadota bacterium]
MSDNDGKKTLSLRGGPRSGNVKQSFSHGRTKNVVVETKRKRIVKPKPGTPASGSTVPDGKRPAGVTDAEWERRMKALAAAKEREAEESAQREADEKAREDEKRRRREEAEAKEREQREAEQRAKAKA